MRYLASAHWGFQPLFAHNYPSQNGKYQMSQFVCLYLGWDSVKVLPQHPPHVFACVWGHLVLEEEGELATLADAVEVAVDLVILATCQKETSNSCKISICRLIYLWLIVRRLRNSSCTKRNIISETVLWLDQTQSEIFLGFFNFMI